MGHNRPIVTFEHCRHVVSKFTTNELRALACDGGCTDPVVPIGHGGYGGGYHGGYGGHHAGYGYAPAYPVGGMGFPFMGGMGERVTPGGKGEYKEVQIHGPVRLSQGMRRRSVATH